MSELISTLPIALALLGCFIVLFQASIVRAFGQARNSQHVAIPPTEAVGVTLLKPLKGNEVGLYENLRSFAMQDYAGPVQMLFGVADAADPAAPVVRRLQAEFPDQGIELVITGVPTQGNPKIMNLIGMAGSIRHEFVVMSDSDIRVEPDYLRRTMNLLEQPDVGLVTWLYRGEGAGGLWATLSTMAIDHQFFPSVLLGLRVRRGRPCVGATMAFSRSTLDSIGGFAAFANHLADDHAIGEAVRWTGQNVIVVPDVVVHRCLERSASELIQHELRWARTIRSIDPSGFAGSVVMYPVPLAFLGALLRGFDLLGSAVLVAALLCRLALQWQVARAVGGESGHFWLRLALGPLRDMLSFGVFCASFLTKTVVWRGHRYRLLADGAMAQLKGSNP